MTEPVQQTIPGTDSKPEALRPRRGRPRGAKARKLGSLFSDGMGDFRLYVIEDNGSLTPVDKAPGFDEGVKANDWLREFGGREDLVGRSILVMRAMFMIRLAMVPQLQFKPRPRLPKQPRAPQAMTAPEPETVST
jgi:hypothetical protein